ncbi:MAG: DUF1778 domain-containing protein [Verrucomicrobiae bacterium]|jgi:uncharacterized protein (DUF1778 family)|nr:DUF1778 domain-containing protein [Verrucomicrobiae bacterium]
METNTTTDERSRITARVPVDARNRLSEAALIRGTSVNSFVIQAALKEAEDVIERDRTIKLSETSAKRLIELIGTPPEPNDHLKDAVAIYKDQVRDLS